MSQPQVVNSMPVSVIAATNQASASGEKQSVESPDSVPAALCMEEVHAAAEAGMVWLWQGYLAPGNITLLTSQWKTGKTTLLSVMLARLRDGGSLAGLPLARGRAVVVSEEGLAHWSRRGRKLGIGNNVSFFCRPFRGRPRTQQWLALIDRLSEMHAEHGIDLVVIDPLASFLPGRGESNAGCMLETLAPLQQLANQGMSVLVMHHPRKGKARPARRRVAAAPWPVTSTSSSR